MARERVLDVENALNLMYEARELLLDRMRQGRVERALAESFERLDHAITFAEHPEELVCLCPNCGSLCHEEASGGRLLCLSCDECWSIQ